MFTGLGTSPASTDFYDVWVIARTFDFVGDRLARALVATFERRKTALPEEPPDALTRSFALDPAKQQQFCCSVEESPDHRMRAC